MKESQKLLRKIILNGGNPTSKIKNLKLNFDYLVEDYLPKIDLLCFPFTKCNLETKETTSATEGNLVELSSLAQNVRNIISIGKAKK